MPTATVGRTGKDYAGRLVNEPDAMIVWIRDRQHLRSPSAMPTLGVTEQEARDIAAYLYTVK